MEFVPADERKRPLGNWHRGAGSVHAGTVDPVDFAFCCRGWLDRRCTAPLCTQGHLREPELGETKLG